MIIFHIISHFDLGGAERIAANIAESNNPKFEYHLIEVEKSKGEYRDDFLNELRIHKVKLHISPIKSRKFAILLFPFWFISIYLKYKPTVIHSHTEIPDLSIFLTYKLFGRLMRNVRFVRTIHNTELWTGWKKIGKYVEKFFIEKKANIAISLSTQKNYEDNYGEKPAIIYNGVADVEQKTFAEIANGRLNILFAGRLEYQKGVDELIQIIEHYKNDNRFFFYVVGNGSKEEELKHRLRGINNVKYYPKIYKLSSYLFSFDYLLMPSNFEGLSLMSIEASMAKLPVIINDCLGLKDTLPEQWPLKVKNNELSAYYNIFDHLHDINRTEVGKQSYEFVKQHFTIKKMRENYESLYLS